MWDVAVWSSPRKINLTQHATEMDKKAAQIQKKRLQELLKGFSPPILPSTATPEAQSITSQPSLHFHPHLFSYLSPITLLSPPPRISKKQYLVCVLHTAEAELIAFGEVAFQKEITRLAVSAVEVHVQNER